MIRNHNKLPTCILLSAGIHGMVFFSFAPVAVKPVSHHKKLIEVAYKEHKEKPAEFKTPYSPPKTKTSLPGLDKIEGQKTSLWNNIPILQDFSKDKMWGQEHEKEPLPMKVSVVDSTLAEEGKKSAEYKSYERLLHEKIRKFAYRYYFSYYKKPLGEIVLMFTLSRAGELLEAGLDEKRSTDNESLRTIALKSIQAAAPFPIFPPNMQGAKKQSFNVRFIFELKRIDTADVQ